jgi:transcriptional regulator with XRE-family HTH domain
MLKEEALRERLVRYMNQSTLSLAVIADAMHISRTTLYKFVNDRLAPQRKTLVKMNNYFAYIKFEG